MPVRDFSLDSELKFKAVVAAWDFYGFDGFEVSLSNPAGERTALSHVRGGKEYLLNPQGNPAALLPYDDNPIPLEKSEPLIKTLDDVKGWCNPRLKVSPLAVSGARLYAILSTMSKRYGVDFLFCKKSDTGKRIIEILSGAEKRKEN